MMMGMAVKVAVAVRMGHKTGFQKSNEKAIKIAI